MKKSVMRKYARLIVRIGANVKKGQPVIVNASVGIHDFVKYVVDEAYKAGAKWVRVEWSFDELTKLAYRHQSLKTLSTVSKWQEEKIKQRVDENPCMIHIVSDDPDGLKGINQLKMQKVQMATYPIMKPYIDQMENQYQWVIAAYPSAEWAKKVFPNDKKSVAVKKLGDAILETVRVTETNDPIEEWNNHNANMAQKCEVMNSYKFEKLVYKSSNGTDFTAWLIPEANWLGGGETALNGNYFNPNMPTEEVFTTPCKGRAEGKLVSTKPLSYQGQLIEDFSITFENGKAVSCEAKKGEELLKKMISMDEGAAMIGELALVPHDSPISNQNILYYSTLFDENASCHVALGRGFSNCIEGFENMTKQDFDNLGVNDSMIHVDFMIGAPDMEIKGYTKDGKCVDVFKNGNWAF